MTARSVQALQHVLHNPHRDRSVRLRCHECQHRRPIPGDAHIACADPYVGMTGDPHGIKNGWFMYPLHFDPTWGSTECPNFAPRNPA